MRIAVQVGLGRGARPVVLGIAESMERRSEDVVKRMEVARRQQGIAVEQAGVLLELAQRLGLHGARNMRV
jgi:protein-disulfide isomerase-like protein with CxxC motif